MQPPALAKMLARPAPRDVPARRWRDTGASLALAGALASPAGRAAAGTAGGAADALQFAAPAVWFAVPSAVLLLVVLALLIVERMHQRRDRRAARLPLAELRAAGGELHAVRHTPWRIGRGKDNDLVIEHVSVSRRHAELRRLPGSEYVVVDLGSLNGVFVNEVQVQTAPVDDGDRLGFGDVTLQLRLLDAPGHDDDDPTIRQPAGQVEPDADTTRASSRAHLRPP